MPPQTFHSDSAFPGDGLNKVQDAGSLRLWLHDTVDATTVGGWLRLHRQATVECRHKEAGKQRRDAKNLNADGVKTTPHRSMSLIRPANDPEVFVKHFHPSEPYKVLRQKLRRQSNARIVYETGREMARRGIAVPLTLAIAESNSGHESFLVTESLAALPTVQSLLRDTARLPESKQRKNRKKTLLAAFAGEWRRMHAAGINYAETHDRHVYVRGPVEQLLDNRAGDWSFVWIDYDGTQFQDDPITGQGALRHLFLLSRDYRRNKRHCRGVLSRTDMLRFLHFYLFGEIAQEKERQAQAREIAVQILAWQPPVANKVTAPVRETVKYLTRPEERTFQKSRRARRKIKNARQAVPLSSRLMPSPTALRTLQRLYKIAFFWLGLYCIASNFSPITLDTVEAEDESADFPTAAAADNTDLITNASQAEVTAVRQLLNTLPAAVTSKDKNTLLFFGLNDDAQRYQTLRLEAHATHLAVTASGALVKQSYQIIGTMPNSALPVTLAQSIHEFFLTRTANNSFTWTTKRWAAPTDAIEALAAAARVEWERPAPGTASPPKNSLLHLVVARRSGRWIALRRLRWEGAILDPQNLQKVAAGQSIPSGYTLDTEWLRKQLMSLPPRGAGTAHLILQRAQNGWVGVGTAWAMEDKISLQVNDAATTARRAMRSPAYTSAAGHKAYGVALAQVGLFEEAGTELEKAEALTPGTVEANLLRQVLAAKSNDPENLAATQLENEAKVGLDPNHPSYVVRTLVQDYANQPSLIRALRLGLEYSRMGDDVRSGTWQDAAQDLIQKGALNQASQSDQQWSQVLYDHLEERRKLSPIKPPLIIRSPLFVLRCWPNDLSTVQVLASLEAAQHTVYADFNLPMGCTEILAWRNQGEFQRYTTRFSSQGQSEFVAALTLTKLISTREGPVVLGEEINVFTDPRTAVFHTVAHEYGHVAVRQLSRGRDVPVWFNEGIATSVEGGYDGYLDRVRLARRANALLTMDEMLEWNVDGQRAFLAYSQANSIVDYIAATWGRDAVMNILRQIGSDIPASTAFQNVLGISQHELWRRWVQNMK